MATQARLIEKLAPLQHRFTDRIRHPAAARAAREPATATGFEALPGHRYCLVVTFKHSGEAVPTPVAFGLDGDKLYFRTQAGLPKVRRLRNDPRVRVAPCNSRGKPIGPLAEGRARVLDADEVSPAHKALWDNYPRSQRLNQKMVDRMIERRLVELEYVEITPAEAESA